jgi:hypothetical protein
MSKVPGMRDWPIVKNYVPEIYLKQEFKVEWQKGSEGREIWQRKEGIGIPRSKSIKAI